MTQTSPPLISVVVPLYDKAEFAERLVGSLLAQTLTDFEVVIVDDGSHDDGADRIARMTREDARFVVHRRDNGGVSSARNEAISLCRGEWVAFLDADDAWNPEYLAVVADAARRWPRAAMISTAHETRTPSQPVTDNRGLLPEDRPIDARGFFEAWLRAGERPVFIGATSIRRECLRKCGGFLPGMNLGEELLTFIRVLEHGQLLFIDRVLATYHLSEAGSLATSPSPNAVRMHTHLIDELIAQVRRERCPVQVLAMQADIHVYHQMQHGMRAGMWHSIWRIPVRWPVRVLAMAVLETVGLRAPLKRWFGRGRRQAAAIDVSDVAVAGSRRR
ncbi:MAG: glycosyltransferase [Burkholderiaceae bacterium]